MQESGRGKISALEEITLCEFQRLLLKGNRSFFSRGKDSNGYPRVFDRRIECLFISRKTVEIISSKIIFANERDRHLGSN